MKHFMSCWWISGTQRQVQVWDENSGRRVKNKILREGTKNFSLHGTGVRKAVLTRRSG